MPIVHFEFCPPTDLILMVIIENYSSFYASQNLTFAWFSKRELLLEMDPGILCLGHMAPVSIQHWVGGGFMFAFPLANAAGKPRPPPGIEECIPHTTGALPQHRC
jgi:hypothetical protein